jgi:hypothetical protein
LSDPEGYAAIVARWRPRRQRQTQIGSPPTDRMAALIAWMLVVRVGNLVKDGAISAVTRVFDALWRRRLRRSSILDKIANTNRNAVQAIKAAFSADS